MKKFLLLSLIVLIGCRPADQTVSRLMVIDGEIVTKPEQAPGSYGIQYWKNGQPIGAASAVAVGPNTFITNGHVVKGSSTADNVKIVDYRGQVLTQFDPNNNKQVTSIVNQKFLSENPGVSMSNDIGAFVVKDDISSEKYTQGFLPVATKPLSPGDNVNLAGNGISDYRALQDREKYSDQGSGTLRFGSNTIAESADGMAFINGNAFKTSNGEGTAVSGPGDSGGSVTTNDSNKVPALSGLMSGGSLYDPSNKQNPYYDYSSNPSGISDQPNSAYSRLVDISQQQAFLQNVNENGGNIAIPTYFNPNDRNKFDSSEVESNQNMYGDAWKGAAIVRSGDGQSYSNYSGGGQYKWAGDQGYQWYNQSGSATDNYTKYDSGSKNWVNSTVPSVPANNQAAGNSTPSTSNTQQPVVIDTPPPDTLP